MIYEFFHNETKINPSNLQHLCIITGERECLSECLFHHEYVPHVPACFSFIDFAVCCWVSDVFDLPLFIRISVNLSDDKFLRPVCAITSSHLIVSKFVNGISQSLNGTGNIKFKAKFKGLL